MAAPRGTAPNTAPPSTIVATETSSAVARQLQQLAAEVERRVQRRGAESLQDTVGAQQREGCREVPVRDDDHGEGEDAGHEQRDHIDIRASRDRFAASRSRRR